MNITRLKKKLNKENIKKILNREGFKNYVVGLLRLKVHPTKIAFSIALGIFVGLAIPMGLQTFAIIPLVLLTNSNLFLAWAATFVTNPLTFIPIYIFSYKVGENILGNPISANYIDLIISDPSWNNVWNLGSEGLVVFLTGLFVIGTLGAAISYVLSLRIIYTYKRLANK
jgi:uncharacterized protein (DUF2062 family)